MWECMYVFLGGMEIRFALYLYEMMLSKLQSEHQSIETEIDKRERERVCEREREREINR